MNMFFFSKFEYFMYFFSDRFFDLVFFPIPVRFRFFWSTNSTTGLVLVTLVQTGLPKEQPIVECVEHIDDLFVPHMAEFEHTNDIVVDMSSSTLVSKLDPKPTSSD
jgi:hypothetical protein